MADTRGEGGLLITRSQPSQAGRARGLVGSFAKEGRAWAAVVVDVAAVPEKKHIYGEELSPVGLEFVARSSPADWETKNW